MAGAFYSKETPYSAWDALVNEFIPDILSHRETGFESLVAMIESYPREPFARAGLEGALWDAYARMNGVPLHTLVGGSERAVPAGLAVGLYSTTDELLDAIARELPRGYARLKIKIEPGWDIEPLRAVRERFGNIPLMVDANASYDQHTHHDVLRALDEFNLIMIEQPLAKEAFGDLAALQREIRTPLCADESAYSPDALERLINEECVRIINIKIQRVGGLAVARRMAERAAGAGLAVWMGTMPELGIATHQAVHLATNPAFTLPSDLHPSDRWYVDDITVPPIEMSGPGTIMPAEWVLNEENINKYSVRTVRTGEY
jgi:O-succinylbenzoate synthase